MPDITSTSGFNLSAMPQYPGFRDPSYFVTDPNRLFQGINQGLETTGNAATMVDRIRAANAQALLQRGQAQSGLSLLPQQTAVESGALSNQGITQQLQGAGLGQQQQQLQQFQQLLMQAQQAQQNPTSTASLDPQTLQQIQALSRASQLTGGLTPTLSQFQSAPSAYAQIADLQSQVAQRQATAAKDAAYAQALPGLFAGRANYYNAKGQEASQWNPLMRSAAQAGIDLNNYRDNNAFINDVQQAEANGTQPPSVNDAKYYNSEKLQTDLQARQDALAKLNHPAKAAPGSTFLQQNGIQTPAAGAPVGSANAPSAAPNPGQLPVFNY